MDNKLVSQDTREAQVAQYRGRCRYSQSSTSLPLICAITCVDDVCDDFEYSGRSMCLWWWGPVSMSTVSSFWGQVRTDLYIKRNILLDVTVLEQLIGRSFVSSPVNTKSVHDVCVGQFWRVFQQIAPLGRQSLARWVYFERRLIVDDVRCFGPFLAGHFMKLFSRRDR